MLSSPVRIVWLQINSLWYFKGQSGGVKNRTAMSNVFPHDIPGLSQRTGWPIVQLPITNSGEHYLMM